MYGYDLNLVRNMSDITLYLHQQSTLVSSSSSVVAWEPDIVNIEREREAAIITSTDAKVASFCR